MQIAAWTILSLWGLMFLRGSLGLLLGRPGDHAWFVWPPMLFGLIPFVLTRSLAGIDTALQVVVAINGGLALVAVIVLSWTRFADRSGGEPDEHR